MDLSQEDINRVVTDNVVISNANRLPFDHYDVPDKSYSEEGFYDVTVGPVVCKSVKHEIQHSYMLKCFR